MNTPADTHPARLTIDYPDHELDRLSTLLRAVYVIPIAVVLGLIGGTCGCQKLGRRCWAGSSPEDHRAVMIGA